MTRIMRVVLVGLLLAFVCGAAWADDDDAGAIKLFRNARQSEAFFSKSYGYAVFPTVGKGGLVIGGAHGDGNVYARGRLIGKATMNQLSVGAQAGGQAYSEIIFFKDKAALDTFTSGNFEFGAGVSAVAITAAASANAGTTGADAGASGTENHAATAASFYKGMAVFTIAKGGLMLEASLNGQKFSFDRPGHG